MTCNSCSSGTDYGCDCLSGFDSGHKCSSKVDWIVYQGQKSVATIRVYNYDLILAAATLTIDFVKAIGDTPTLTLSSINTSEISISNNLVNGELPVGETLYSDISIYLTASQVDSLGAVSGIMIGDLIINCDINIPPIRYNIKYNKTT